MYQLYALLALYIYIYIERRKIDRTNSPLISWPTFHALQLCFYRRARIPSFWRAVVLSNYPRDLEKPSGEKDGLIMCCYLRPIKTKFIRFFFFLLFLFFLPRLTIPPVFFPSPLMLLSRVQFFFETRDNHGRDSLLFHAGFVANRRIDMEKHLSRNFFLSIANMYGNNLVISL